MIFALSSQFGAVTSTAAALLFAPPSGQELRSNIKSQAENQYARLQDEYHNGLQVILTRMDKMSSELQVLSSRFRWVGNPTWLGKVKRGLADRRPGPLNNILTR